MIQGSAKVEQDKHLQIAAKVEQDKHLQIAAGISHLDDAIDGVECLISRLKGEPNGEKKAPETPNTLLTVLSDTGDELHKRADAIYKHVNEIIELLF